MNSVAVKILKFGMHKIINVTILKIEQFGVFFVQIVSKRYRWISKQCRPISVQEQSDMDLNCLVRPDPENIKKFMLNSAEHEIFPAHKW